VRQSLPHVLAQAILRHFGTALALAVLAAPLAACNDHSATTLERPAFVHTEIVQPRDRQASLTLTGEVQARFGADLSFRVSGRGKLLSSGQPVTFEEGRT
jgi:membrane fusion protein, multidrug efflux system